MKNYTWTVSSLYTVDTESETDYVVNAVYEVVGTEEVDGVAYTSSIKDTAKFEVVSGDDFVPYADLTNDTVVEWIKSELGELGVEGYENAVGGMIDSQVTPPTVPTNTALPW